MKALGEGDPLDGLGRRVGHEAAALLVREVVPLGHDALHRGRELGLRTGPRQIESEALTEVLEHAAL